MAIMVWMGLLAWHLRVTAGQSSSTTSGVCLSDGPGIGAVAPDFKLPDLAGHSVALSSLRGHAVPLVFFCGCDRCDAAAKRMGKLQRKGKLKMFTAVIALDPADASAFVHACGIKGTFLTDPSDDTAETYGSSFCPRYWIIARDGKVAYKSGIALEGSGLKNALEYLEAHT